MSGIFRRAGTGGGTGDVVGPASSTNDHFALFDGTTGKLLKDSGYSVVPETSGGTGQTTYTQGDILYSDASNSLTKRSVSSYPGVPLISNGSLPNWFDPAFDVYIVDDFITTVGNGPEGIIAWQRGGPGFTAGETDAEHPGTIAMETGGTANCGISSGNPIRSGAGRLRVSWIAKLSNLSDSSDDYTARIGLGDRVQPSFYNNGIWFEYNHAVNSGNWTIASNGYGGGAANTSTAADTSWHKYTIDINATGTSANCYIDDVEVANSPVSITNNTNILGPAASIQQTSGSNNRILTLDLCELYIRLTNKRY